jgi:hypothetical protein
MVLLAGRQLANFSILFLTDSRPAKNKNTLLVGRWPAKSFFEKGQLTGKTLLRV